MIPLIIFAIVFGCLAYGFISTRIAFFKEMVPFKDYSGKFKNILIQGTSYLGVYEPIKDFDVYIYVGPDHDRDSFAGQWGWWLKPTINLNEQQLGDLSWMRDFNASARAWGLPELQDEEDNALFLLFHEYRHCLQEKGKVTDYHTLPLTPENVKNILPYRLLPNESDADWYAFTQVKKFRVQ